MIYGVGSILCLVNLYMTMRQGQVADESKSTCLGARAFFSGQVQDAVSKDTPREKVNALHALVERWPFLMIVLSSVALACGGIAEIAPNLIQGGLTPKIEAVKPYTPLELHGRDIYIREGCISCHTPMVVRCVRTPRATAMPR